MYYNIGIGAMIAALMLAVAGCKNETKSDPPVVDVDGVVLTKSKVFAAIPANASSEDSALIAEEYVRRWVYQQVALRKSRLNLTDEEQQIEEAVNEYRESLLVERFQQKVLKEKFKPKVTSDAIEKYYNEHKNYFVLNETLVRGIFVVVKDKVDGVKKFRNLISTLDGEHMADIENFVYHNSLKYEISLEKWITLASIKDYLPDNQIPNEASTLRNRKLVEVRNADLCYFILVTDCKMQGEEAPLEYVSDNITNILVNKQKIDFIKDLKSELYNDAVQQQLITYYDNK